MTTLYYLASDGTPMLADLSIIDSHSGTSCEADILGNMGITGPGTGIHRVPQDDCDSDLERAALAAGARWYADDEGSAQWWADYVAGYNATQDEADALREELREMSDEQLRAVADAQGLECKDYKLVDAIIEDLYGSWEDYEDERATFRANLAYLRVVMEHLT